MALGFAPRRPLAGSPLAGSLLAGSLLAGSSLAGPPGTGWVLPGVVGGGGRRSNGCVSPVRARPLAVSAVALTGPDVVQAIGSGAGTPGSATSAGPATRCVTSGSGSGAPG